MSKYGFVYILVNDYMPDVYKVGCTERSPHERAAELSNHTGVPAPFKVLCYIEVQDFQAVEKKVHGWLQAYRLAGREFFFGEVVYAVRLLFWLRDRVSFVVPGGVVTGEAFGSISALEEQLECGINNEFADPWRPKPPKPEPAAEVDPAVLKVVDAAIARIETGEQPKSDEEPF